MLPTQQAEIPNDTLMLVFTILWRMLLTAQEIGTEFSEYDHSCNKGGQARIARLDWKICCRLRIAYRLMPTSKSRVENDETSNDN